MIRKSGNRFSERIMLNKQVSCQDGSGSSVDLAGRFLIDIQLRVACQVPLQRSPVMIPRHAPLPLLPASRPPPVAVDAPTDTLTATLPPRPTVPETLPPPADETRLPLTLNGTL
jgi:hypothetical protein